MMDGMDNSQGEDSQGDDSQDDIARLDISRLGTSFNRIRQVPKWRLFGVLLGITLVIAAIASFITHLTVLTHTSGPAARVAVIAPLSGPDRALGIAVQRGVELWAKQMDHRRGIGGRPVEVVSFDENDPASLARATEDPQVIGVVGPTGAAAATAAAPVLSQAGMVGLTLSGVPAAGSAEHPSLLPIGPDSSYETRFLANYVRNVVGEKLVSILLPDTAEAAAQADAFDAVLQRFGTRVVYRWAIPTGDGRDAALASTSADIFDRKIAGALLVLGGPDFAARSVAALRAAHVPNRIAGGRALASQAFLQTLREVWHGPTSVGAVLNNTLVATPMLFDTAGLAAQAFRSDLVAETGVQADWAAALGFDAGRLIESVLAPMGDLRGTTQVMIRANLRDRLAALRDEAHSVQGLAGPIFFARDGASSLPVLMGSYDGQELVSALTQLTPIREEGVSNFLQELTAGRALYVNDRFMYKTNVAYSGIRLEKVFDINPSTNIADLEFVLWFRWSGSFDPQDVVFPNAVQPVRLANPEREGKSGALSYRAYRVHAKFYMNPPDIARPYGSQSLQVVFRHRSLSRVNLLYVSDVLGMGLGDVEAAANDKQAATSWLDSVLPHKAHDILAAQLEQSRALAGVGDWVVSRALLSQENVLAGTDGDPVYVGFGRPASLFSLLGLGVIVKPDAIDVRDFIPGDWFVYIGIFALSGALLAHVLDRRDRGQFWRIQTLLLRLVTWPVLLAAVSNVVLDFALNHATPSVVGMISQFSHALWWIVPARLAAISVERFLWVPIETHTRRRVPTVFRILVSLVIYAAALLGILAFVLERTITSLLASTGLLAMIVGLAIQSNLKDIFSGIMLNLERPFGIDDWVRINRIIVGRVVDVTWRTTRLKTADGILALPNGRMSDAEIENLSRGSGFNAEVVLLLAPHYPPDAVIRVVELLVAGIEEPAFTNAAVRFKGVDNVSGRWVARYFITANVAEYPLIVKFANAVWTRLWRELHEHGVEWDGAADVEIPEQPYSAAS